MNQVTKYLFILLTLGSLIGCSPKMVLPILPEVKVERVKTAELVASLDSLYKLQVNSFYAKVDTRYKDTSSNYSFKTSIRSIKDSAITLVATYSGFPVLGAIITPDSLKYNNKRNKCYSISNLNQLKDQFNVDFDFKILQQLLLGVPFGYSPEHKYYQIHESNVYVLCNYKKREVKKLERKSLDDFIIKYYLSTSRDLQKIEIENPKDYNKVIITFSDRKEINGYLIPHLISVFVKTSSNNLYLDLEYERVEINEEQEIYFTIPESYEICN